MWHRSDMTHEHVSTRMPKHMDLDILRSVPGLICGNKSDKNRKYAFASAMIKKAVVANDVNSGVAKYVVFLWIGLLLHCCCGFK